VWDLVDVVRRGEIVPGSRGEWKRDRESVDIKGRRSAMVLCFGKGKGKEGVNSLDNAHVLEIEFASHSFIAYHVPPPSIPFPLSIHPDHHPQDNKLFMNVYLPYLHTHFSF
jgi:hypothetical protein